MNQLTRFVFGHPFVRAVVIAALGIVANVLSGSYVFEITKNDPKLGQFINWRGSLESRSFWGLVVVAVLTGLYLWVSGRFEARARRTAISEADMLGLALGELFDSLIERTKSEMKAGKVNTVEDVKKIFGSGGGQP